MNLISQVLQEKRECSTCALIPFITAGYPNIDTTIEVLYTLDRQGADIIELGIPYSDALADGPLIQEASKVALQQGIYIDDVLSILDQVQSQLRVPIIIFSYYNPILARGIEKFLQEFSACGVKGLVIPDLPIEETDYLITLCAIYHIELILFISPTSPKDRILNILSKAPGCVYLVSSTGLTGVRNTISNNINNLSKFIKSSTDKLIMLGFGISSSAQVSKVSSWDIDAVVIGSAFIKILSNHCNGKYDKVNKSTLIDVGSFCSKIKSSIRIN
uniref:Tryptophan synthase alpha chain n=1 Tax=Kuetzingia canaliculata TaxID=228262 RepID=A0A1Z1MPM3_KUECA|nr:Tryptophan synthase alpha subunit [Kuetzingia canaliculata]ARW67809.1 Tryptophan synthase alpha subunit [Kuetzingia canaliculata]